MNVDLEKHVLDRCLRWTWTGLVVITLLAACQAAPTLNGAERLDTAVSYTLTAWPSPTPGPTSTPVPSSTPLATLTPAPSLTPTGTFTPTATSSPTRLPAEPIGRGPYLQQAEPGSMWVVWETENHSTGYVEYGTQPALGQVAAELSEHTQHAVQLTGLRPYTTYYYRVAGESTISSFRSAPTPQQDTFHFAVIGDTRSDPQAHAAVVAQMVQSHPDFALHLGDLVNNGSFSDDWDQFLKIESPLMRIAPLYPTLGNHEGANPQYFQIFHLPGNEHWYSFDYGRARFVVLQGDDYATKAFQAGGEQRAWLEQQLASTPGDWLFVSLHTPIHTSFYEDSEEVNLRKQLEPLFQKYRVDVVFAGHYHQYERIQTGGVTYIISGGGGAPMVPFSTPEAGSKLRSEVFEFVHVEINGKQATFKTIEVTSKLIDQFSLTSRR